MPCKHYKDSLVEAAATGAEPQGELRAHLGACASCRTAFAEEQSLFASIDAGLRATVTAGVPPSLLPRVRAGLDEAVAPQRRWMQPLIFASASIAIAFLLFLMVRPHRTGLNDQAVQIRLIPVPVKTQTNTHGEIPAPGVQIASAAANHSHATRNSTLLRSVASSKPEVLVPADERLALARFVAKLNERSGAAAALLAPAAEKKDAPLSVDPLEIARLEVEPLDDETETRSHGGTEELH
jgi:anti-sigma factor RsiW